MNRGFVDFLAQQISFCSKKKGVFIFFFPSKLPWIFPTSMDFPHKKRYSKLLIPVGSFPLSSGGKPLPGGGRNPGNQWYQSGPLALHLSPIKIRCGIPWDKTPSAMLVL
jgi:hypothetical protein